MKIYPVDALSATELLRAMLLSESDDGKYLLICNPEFTETFKKFTDAKEIDGYIYSQRFRLYIEPDASVKIGLVKKLK